MDGKLITIDQIKRVVKNAVSGVVLRGDFFPSEMHRTIFRGKNLGTTLTAKQKQAISDGTFEDLWLGDYWVINGVTWRIVDMDYWLNTGNPLFTVHHLVIMPDTCLGPNKQMNDTNTTDGGYVGSMMYTSNMDESKTMCSDSFGSSILTHREVLSSEVANSRPSSYVWVYASIELPTEVMIYGCNHFGVGNDGVKKIMKYDIDKSQLSLFSVAPKFIPTMTPYWLRDIVSDTGFAVVSNYGYSDAYSASNQKAGVRPVFPIGVPA